jgi:hypothetical protein
MEILKDIFDWNYNDPSTAAMMLPPEISVEII